MKKTNKSLIDLLCCMCDSDVSEDERDSFGKNSSTMTGELKAQKNELVLLGDPNEFFALARIT